MWAHVCTLVGMIQEKGKTLENTGEKALMPSKVMSEDLFEELEVLVGLSTLQQS